MSLVQHRLQTRREFLCLLDVLHRAAGLAIELVEHLDATLHTRRQRVLGSKAIDESLRPALLGLRLLDEVDAALEGPALKACTPASLSANALEVLKKAESRWDEANAKYWLGSFVSQHFVSPE